MLQGLCSAQGGGPPKSEHFCAQPQAFAIGRTSVLACTTLACSHHTSAANCTNHALMHFDLSGSVVRLRSEVTACILARQGSLTDAGAHTRKGGWMAPPFPTQGYGHTKYQHNSSRLHPDRMCASTYWDTLKRGVHVLANDGCAFITICMTLHRDVSHDMCQVERHCAAPQMLKQPSGMELFIARAPPRLTQTPRVWTDAQRAVIRFRSLS